MAKPTEKLRPYNVFLLKTTIAKYEDALRNKKLVPLPLISLSFTGQLYIDERKRPEPDWIKFLRTGISGTIKPSPGETLSAVLFISTAKRIFALTWGYGRNLLKPDCYERRFGLKVVVNRVDPDKIGTMDLKSFEELVVKRREEMSKDTKIASFSVNVQNMLRSVIGEPTNKTLDGLPANSVDRVGGSDCLNVYGRIPFKTLGKLCKASLDAYEDDKYKKNGFKWIDNIAAVNDPIQIAKLDQQLVDEIKAKHTSNLEMTLPEDIDITTLETLVYSDDATNTHYAPHLNVDEWFGSIQNFATLTVDSLKEQEIRLYGGGDNDIPNRVVSVYECLNFEPPGAASSRFLFANGEWFEINVDYDKEINDYIAQMSKTVVILPDAIAGETEPKYIARIASPGKLDSIHTAHITVDGTMVELCDLLSPAGQLIHLKRWSNSQTFSALLGQGAGSAEILAMKPAYLKAAYDYLVKEKIGVAKKFAPADFDRKDIEVVFGLMRSTVHPLPFFSRLNLMRNGERIQRAGYRVGFKKIHQPK